MRTVVKLCLRCEILDGQEVEKFYIAPTVVNPDCTLCLRRHRLYQGGHKPVKPEILGDFYERGKLREFCAASGKNWYVIQTFCKAAVDLLYFWS